jgi:AraC-like DNA-binding protein
MKNNLQKNRSEAGNVIVEAFEPKGFNDCIEAIYTVETFSEEVSLIVPPNQFTGLVFFLNNKGYHRNGNFIQGVRGEGIVLKSVHAKISPYTKILGVRMYGSGLYPFIPLNGKSIIGNSKPVSLPDHEELVLQILYSKDYSKAISLVSKLLSRLYDPGRDKETQLVKEFYVYMKSCKNILPNINDFCQQTSTNYSTLNRAFQKILGLSTKKFERLIKFRRAYHILINAPDRLTNIGIDTGYYDQSHFIREFKYFMNMPPKEYLNYLKTNQEYQNFKNINLDVI